MIAISLLSHTEFGLNDHREDANPFSCYTYAVTIFQGNMSDLLFYLTITLRLRHCNSYELLNRENNYFFRILFFEFSNNCFELNRTNWPMVLVSSESFRPDGVHQRVKNWLFKKNDF